jgi:hypothetical protein
MRGVTSGRGFQLAQVNIGRLRAPITDPMIAGFTEALDEVNALADASPGFVWRLQTEDGNATAVRAFDDDSILINMSVWESIEALADFVYRSHHVSFLRRRAEWFERTEQATVVLWWVPAGHQPTAAEAVERLALLQANGPGPRAFTFRRPFTAPPEGAAPLATDDRNACPA